MAAIYLIPWHMNCLETLADFLLRRFGDTVSRAVAVFPHRRPKRYLIRALAADARLRKPGFLPRILTIGDLLALTTSRLGEPALKVAGELDAAGLLFEVAGRLRGQDGDREQSLAAALPDDLGGFFPWGLRLYRLFEEMSRQNLTPEDLLYPGDELMPPAAALLRRLGTIHREYLTELDSRGWTTPGLTMAKIAADAQATGRALDAALGGAPVVACGFHILNGCEEILLKTLWRRGQADIVWHTDPALAAPGRAAHWSCDKHARWLERWKARPVLWPPDASPAPPASSIRFVEGFDLHSQLCALQEDLTRAPDMDGRAVVIPDPGMLMPVLHHLPSPEVNISMGYPLARSPLAGLIETLFALQASKLAGQDGEDRYYWRDMIALIRQPYLKMLGQAEAAPLRVLLSAMEGDIRRGGKHLDPFAWRPPELPDDPGFDPDQALTLLHRVFTVCLGEFSGLATLGALASALAGLAGLLLDPELRADIWERFLIDAECLSRLVTAVIPALRGAYVAGRTFDRDTLFAVARELLAAERVSFEADPITGLQLLGVLETRLLTFKSVHVLSAQDDNLPGPAPNDPLVPDSLRRTLGLPDSSERDVVAAHNFFRLLAGADQVVLYYGAGVSSGAILDDKSVRSRFVEELVFAEETRQGKLLRPGDGPITAVAPRIGGLAPARAPLAVSSAIRARLEGYLASKPLSARFFDTYLGCPERFFYTYLTPVRPPEEVAEEGDPMALGSLAHEALGEYFGARLNQAARGGEAPARELAAIYTRRLREAAIHRQSSHDLRLLMERFGASRMREYGQGFAACRPLAVEAKLAASFTADGRIYSLTGVLDRLDRREQGAVIVDYKTGGARKAAPGFFTDEDFFARLTQADAQDPELFERVARGLASVQLPLYALLRLLTSGELAANAAYVLLRDGGKESPLFAPGLSEQDRRVAVAEKTPALLGFLIRRMLGAPSFEARPSQRCAYCAYRRLCAAPPGAAS
ncbi:MAG: PD-(D/E)XK nuclease family protein [Desulfovibrionaceae bacterium]|nr:PD-(D/E)XK nuclease family protein [Desulfovibrionaceae bacterium]MBF0514810.1 PD-(D/E)XK nuclease family protein [Desulfovibrionaceae bacterium]